MSLVFDKHRLLSGLALQPSELREPNAVGRRHNADTVLTVGLINIMPDAALQATERQFKGLLKSAAGSIIVDLRYFSLPSVRRSAAAQSRIERYYTRIVDLKRLRIDGLIVTDAEPKAECLREEPYWQELTDLVDWAADNTCSTIWSCLAAHSAVLYLDGIKRQRLSAKCSGVFECSRVSDGWLTQDLPPTFKVSHSRLNELKADDLGARGYQILTTSREVGVDIFAKQLRSHFIFFQGHPEYDGLSLRREYRRDVSRFLKGEKDTYPIIPSGYFTDETRVKLASFRSRALSARTPTLLEELPPLILRPDIQTEAAAKLIFRNWLRYLTVR